MKAADSLDGRRRTCVLEVMSSGRECLVETDLPLAVFFDEPDRAPIGGPFALEFERGAVALHLLVAYLGHVGREELALDDQEVVQRLTSPLGLPLPVGERRPG